MPELVDQWGRPVKEELLREPQAAPTFHGVRNIYSIAHPSIALTPERLTAVLRQMEWGDPWLALELFHDMEEKDLHYLSVLSTRKQTVAQLELTVKPASEDSEAKKDADFIREVLLDDDGLALQSTFADIEDAIGKGFSCTEIMWGDGSDGSGGMRWYPTRLAWRDPRWFMFDWIAGEQVLVRTWRNSQTLGSAVDAWTDEGWKFEMGGLIERTPEMARIGIQPATAPLIPYKFITHIAKAKSGVPIRGGLSRAIAWIYLFKNYIIKDWVTYAERYGMPARIGHYAPGATDDDKNTLMRACVQLGSDAASIIPDSMKIELLEAQRGGGARGVAVYADASHYFDEAMSKAVLGQTLTTEMQGTGSRAAAQVHENVRRDILQWDAVRLAQTLSRDLIRPLVDLNRGPRDRYPSLILKIQTGADKMWMEMVGNAADHGVEIGQDAVRDQLGLPAPLTGEKLLTPRQSGTSGSPGGATIGGDEGGDQPPGGDVNSRHSETTDDPTPNPTTTWQPQPHASAAKDRVARVVILEGDGVWAIKPEKEKFTMLPGGHVEDGESFEEAAVREAREETGFEVKLTRWLADFVDEHAHRRYFAARRVESAAPSEVVRDGDGGGKNSVARLSTKDGGDPAYTELTSEYDRAAVEKAMSRKSAHAARKRPARPAAKTEEYAARLAADWRPPLEPMLHKIAAHLANARDLPDAQARLHELVADMDTSTFERVLTEAGFNVRAAARAKVKLP